MSEQPEDAWERLAAICEAADIRMVVVDQTPRFKRWRQGYIDRIVAEARVPDHPTESPTTIEGNNTDV